MFYRLKLTLTCEKKIEEALFESCRNEAEKVCPKTREVCRILKSLRDSFDIFRMFGTQNGFALELVCSGCNLRLVIKIIAVIIMIRFLSCFCN